MRMKSADFPEMSGIAPGLCPSVPWQPAHEALSISPGSIAPAWTVEAGKKAIMIETATSGNIVELCIAKFLVLDQ
jgi:hypothetical protein